MESNKTLEWIINAIVGLSLDDKRRLLASLQEHIALAETQLDRERGALRETPVAYQDSVFDVTQTQTWQLCGMFEIANPEPEFVVGQDAQGRVITNYAEHVDNMLYPGHGSSVGCVASFRVR